jgi:hypothetical protein
MSTILKPEIADIFRLYGQEYQRRYGESILPSHQKTLQKIQHCRTPTLGGQVYLCSNCGQLDYSYHSCNDRNCPKCGGDKIQAWIKKQLDELLPVPYFFVGFTLPEEFRTLVRSHQSFFYNLFFKTSSQALKDLAGDKRFVGGEIGFSGILQTWARNLLYHPHIHYLVPGIALSSNHKHFRKIKNKKFLIHVLPLGRHFKSLFQKALKKTDFSAQIPQKVWEKDWVVHCQPAGSGQEIIKYVAPYVYRVAISNHKLIKIENRKVTFTYQDSETRETKTCTLEVLEFIRRFLQHVLPPGFIKVRYFGIMGANIKNKWFLLKYLLIQSLSSQGKEWFLSLHFEIHKKVRTCTTCGGLLILLGHLPRGP